MEAINQLVELGNSFIIIEHNLDVIKLLDHIIDIGPEGGKTVAKSSQRELLKN